MPVFRLGDEVVFPDPETADPSGVIAVGGDLRPERLLAAYRAGIFPWPSPDWPLLWHAPDPRWVVVPRHLRISRTMRKVLHRHPFQLTLDRDFDRVIEACSSTSRPGQDGTWLDPAMVDAYRRLFQLGYAHSAEAWLEGELVGGLYGVALGRVFFGESMFARVSNASKVAFVTLVRQLERWQFALVDCQVHTSLLASFGAIALPRRVFGDVLRHACALPSPPSPWSLDADLAEGAER